MKLWSQKRTDRNERYRESNRLSAARRYAQRRKWLSQQKDRPCMDCGGRFLPCQMEFDHRDASDKRFIIGPSLHRSIRALLEEIAKCDLVCANCHRLRTLRRRLPTADALETPAWPWINHRFSVVI